MFFRSKCRYLQVKKKKKIGKLYVRREEYRIPRSFISPISCFLFCPLYKYIFTFIISPRKIGTLLKRPARIKEYISEISEDKNNFFFSLKSRGQFNHFTKDRTKKKKKSSKCIKYESCVTLFALSVF